MKKVKDTDKIPRDIGARIVFNLKRAVREANALFLKRNEITLLHNKFANSHKWNRKNKYAKKLDLIANELAKKIAEVSRLERRAMENEDWELYKPMINNIFSNQYILTKQNENIQDQVQHGTKRRSVNLARTSSKRRRKPVRKTSR